MVGFVFLFRYSDFYNIGFTYNLANARHELRPTEIVSVIKTDNAEEVVRKLQENYNDARLPGSDYYRLTKLQALECKRKLKEVDGAISYKPFFSGYRLAITFITFWIGISFIIIRFGVDPIFDWLM